MYQGYAEMSRKMPDSVKKTKTRFAVLFDTHYCLGTDTSLRTASGASDDLPRYNWMRQELFPRLISELRDHAPEFCVCTGDIVEGARRPDAAVPGNELTEVFTRFSDAGLPVLNARGTHEPRAEYTEIALPRFSEFIGTPVTSCYFSHDADNARFVLLDYLSLAPGSDQAVWFQEQCATVPPGRSLFVFAHAPLANFARPLFSHRPMQEVLKSVFSEYPPTVFFCGHTHNQALSYHRLGNTGFTQIKGSGVGFPANPLERLADRHALLLDAEDTCYWGVAEDVAPGYWICEAGTDGTDAAWYGIGRGRLARIRIPSHRGKPPEIVAGPDFPDLQLRKDDLPLVRTAALEYFLRSPEDGGITVSLNGINLGQAPAGRYYAARNLLPVPPGALVTLRDTNRLVLETHFSACWMLGGLRLVVTTLDGRYLTTRCHQKVMMNGDYAAELGQHPLVETVPEGQTTVEIDLKIL